MNAASVQRAPQRGGWIKTVLAGFGALTLAALLGLGLFVWFWWTPFQARVLQTCTQPDSIVYRSGETYEVFRRSSDVNVGRDPNYGVAVELNSSSKDADVRCEWTGEGVTVVESNGISHFIPAKVFVGGR